MRKINERCGHIICYHDVENMCKECMKNEARVVGKWLKEKIIVMQCEKLRECKGSSNTGEGEEYAVSIKKLRCRG